MFIPGDNDIGGERTDTITSDKTNRFKEGFNEQTYMDVLNTTRIFNINLLTHVFPNVSKDSTPSQYNRIAISHYSILSYPGFYSDKVSIIVASSKERPALPSIE